MPFAVILLANTCACARMHVCELVHTCVWHVCMRVFIHACVLCVCTRMHHVCGWVGG